VRVGCWDEAKGDLGRAHFATWVQALEVSVNDLADLVLVLLEVHGCVFLAVAGYLVVSISKKTEEEEEEEEAEEEEEVKRRSSKKHN